jgi:hypothetical protein
MDDVPYLFKLKGVKVCRMFISEKTARGLLLADDMHRGQGEEKQKDQSQDIVH